MIHNQFFLCQKRFFLLCRHLFFRFEPLVSLFFYINYKMSSFLPTYPLPHCGSRLRILFVMRNVMNGYWVFCFYQGSNFTPPPLVKHPHVVPWTTSKSTPSIPPPPRKTPPWASSYWKIRSWTVFFSGCGVDCAGHIGAREDEIPCLYVLCFNLNCFTLRNIQN